MKKWMCVALLPLMMCAGSCSALAGGLYNLHDSPYATFIARKPGDLLTLVVEEHAVTSDNGSREHERSNEFSFKLKDIFFPSINAAKGLTATKGGGDQPVLEWESNSDYDARASSRGDHKFLTTMQVQIVEEVSDGQLVIRGFRTVNLNGKNKKILVSGVIRQRDISRNNTISSFQVADAVIQIDGDVADSDVEPGIFNKMLNYVF